METSAAVVNIKDGKVRVTELGAQEIARLVDTAATVKQHLEAWEQAIDAKLSAAEQAIDKQLSYIQTVITQFNRTLQTNTYQEEWQHAVAAIHTESKQQTATMQETCTDLKKATKEIHTRVERTANQLTKSLNQTMQGLRTGELQQLVEDSATDVKNFATASTAKVDNIVKWFHWKNLGIVFFLSIVVTLLVSLYIDDEWPWEAHKTVVKQRLAGQAVLSAWPQLTQLDREQIMDDFA